MDSHSFLHAIHSEHLYFLYRGATFGEAFHSLDWIFFLVPPPPTKHMKTSSGQSTRLRCDIFQLHQFRYTFQLLHCGRTIYNLQRIYLHIMGKLFTVAFTSSTTEQPHYAWVIVWLRDIHCPLYELNERTAEQWLIQASSSWGRFAVRIFEPCRSITNAQRHNDVPQHPFSSTYASTFEMDCTSIGLISNTNFLASGVERLNVSTGYREMARSGRLAGHLVSGSSCFLSVGIGL